MKITYNMQTLFYLLEKQYKLMNDDQDDRVVCIVGETGSGKSNLLKHIFHYWHIEILKNEPNAETYQNFCHNDQDWVKSIKESKDKPFTMITHDEAVNILYSKEAITKKNRYINKMFNIIRGKRFYHIMCIPKIWRLDSEMREDRLKGLINITKVGKDRIGNYYNAKTLNFLLKEIDVMKKTYKDSKQKPDIKYCKTRPDFSFKIPLYKGWLDKYYNDKKQENMDKAIDEVFDVIMEKREEEQRKKEKKPLTEQQQRTYELLKSNMKIIDIAKELNRSQSYVSGIVSAIKKKGYS